MNLQRLLLPQVRIQRRCPWEFPATKRSAWRRWMAERAGSTRGITGADIRRVSRAGPGIWTPERAVHELRTTRGAIAQARGMFSNGSAESSLCRRRSRCGRSERRASHTSAVSVNEARYNDFVPMVYGTAWYQPPVVFARNDGNLTRMEVLLGMGEMQGVLKVLVNDVEIPVGVAGTNMTGTGWYNILNAGHASRARCNGDFTDGSGQPAGDPYGSMAYLSVVVPNRMNDGTSLPRVKVLVQGLKLPTYGTDGSLAGEQFSARTRRGSCWTCCGGGAGARRRSTWRASRGRRRTATSRSRRWT